MFYKLFYRCVGALVGLAMMGMAGTVDATLITFEIEYSTSVGTGSFVYDDVGLVVTDFETEFGAFGSRSLGFVDTSDTALFFGNPPEDFFEGVTGLEIFGGTAAFAVWRDDGFFCLTGGSATFDCVGTEDTSIRVLSGTYRFVEVPEPSTLALFAFGLAGLGFMTRRRRSRRRQA